VENKPLAAEGAAQSVQELAAKDVAENFQRQEKVRRGWNPPLPVARQTAAGHDTVDVRVTLQGLAPGMKNAQEADLRPEMLGIGRDFQECAGAGLEQQL